MTDRRLILRILQYSKPYWVHITGFFLLSLASAPFTFLTPLPLKIAVDNIIGSQPLPDFLSRLLPGAVVKSILENYLSKSYEIPQIQR